MEKLTFIFAQMTDTEKSVSLPTELKVTEISETEEGLEVKVRYGNTYIIGRTNDLRELGEFLLNAADHAENPPKAEIIPLAKKNKKKGMVRKILDVITD